ncbi:Schizosaccharomyces pombe specific protein Mug106 [Schizosaccharomyces pombe]|uniref:Meiotically up-regulated gene 106 protein n=1 Tax=Schizosaccharomyces pombe (strain 972 / ATCC 24843) TaxID=284812 RepID=MU106_SCHPO|nr:protein mug106 [Schizosaccharomyces pombe]Q10493.1 RecName: Full=Meiotically up-regulated gene 106 protein; Flags: Precursor [Schizosaccharomyces pombe 972h-]CAA97362.1 sequence orphan [Schizosaccharomyces pombe]|eukprot:NP_594890.1 protein mug106 [Schizosaccharomyces pombe]
MSIKVEWIKFTRLKKCATLLVQLSLLRYRYMVLAYNHKFDCIVVTIYCGCLFWFSNGALFTEGKARDRGRWAKATMKKNYGVKLKIFLFTILLAFETNTFTPYTSTFSHFARGCL